VLIFGGNFFATHLDVQLHTSLCLSAMISNNFRSTKVVRNIFKSTFLLGWLVTALLAPAWAETSMVWSQYEKPNINIYYSPDGSQTIALTSQGINIIPNLFKSRTSTWITWIDNSNEKVGQLKYAQVTNRGQILEIGTIPTTHPGIYGSAIALDPSESRAWAVWAENNGQREVLYASFRDLGKQGSGKWQAPLQITSDDEYSSNLPVIDAVLFNQITVSWLRTSSKASEAASASLFASDWNTSKSTNKIDEFGSKAVRVNYRNLRVKKTQDYDAHIKRLRKGQPLSSDEQAWKNLIRDKDVISGAVHSGAGRSKRLAEESK
jgi:hypothetical protein